MKRKFMLILITILLGFCAACKSDHKFNSEWMYDDDYHWQECVVKGHTDTTEKELHQYKDEQGKICIVCGKTLAYTDEENVEYWIEGRNYSVSYEGSYTSTVNISSVEDNHSSDVQDIVESYNGKNKYVNSQKYTVIEGDNESSTQLVFVVEPAKNGNIDCAKQFVMSTYENKGQTDVNKYAVYTSPNIISEMINYSPNNSFCDNGSEKGNTFDEIKQSFIEYLKGEDVDNLDNFNFVRNNDGSVSLIVEAHTSFETKDINGVDTTVQYQLSIEIKVLDAKVVSIKNESLTKCIYEDTSLNTTTKRIKTIDLTYEFDEKLFNSIDTKTDEIINEYVGNIKIYLDGYSIYKSNMSYEVGSKITLEEIKANFFDSVRFWNGDFKNNADYNLYFDKEKTQPVPSEFDFTKEEYDLYLTVTPHEGYAIVLTVFDEKDYEGEIVHNPHIAYLVEENSRFFPRRFFTDYPIVSIDGKQVGEYTSFVCKENRIYEVVYDRYSGTEVVIEHKKYVEEWTMSEYYHWHQCDDCGNEQLEFGVHVFKEVDGKNVCSTCGYEE